MASHHTCCDRQKVNRGLWSPEEDQKLISYVTTYGHGCWSSVPRLAGLQRCGKSCRLRWINYMRPDVKRGNFTPQEAALIIELHRILGNRWSQIAKYLPGRTDNEVKNFWNSSIKKKLIAHARHLRPSDLYFAARLHHSPENSSNLMIPNPENEHPVIPSEPAMASFYCSIDSPFDQMMNPVTKDSSWASPYDQPTGQDQDESSPMLGFENHRSYDVDREVLEALLPELDTGNSSSCSGFPAPMWGGCDEYTGGYFPGCEEMHPYHIDNITSLMATFAQPDPPPECPPSSDSHL